LIESLCIDQYYIAYLYNAHTLAYGMFISVIERFIHSYICPAHIAACNTVTLHIGQVHPYCNQVH